MSGKSAITIHGFMFSFCLALMHPVNSFLFISTLGEILPYLKVGKINLFGKMPQLRTVS